MEILRKTDYALRMLSELVRSPGCVVSVRAAAQDNDISYSFARSIQHDLALAGIVESLRGARGGMKLAIDPKETTLLQLVVAVQGPILVSTCEHAGENNEPCPFMPECHFNPVWCSAEGMLREFLASVSLYDVVVRGKVPRYTGGFDLVSSDGAAMAAEG